MLAKSFCWGKQSQLHLSNSKQCLKSLTEGRCGCLLSAITMGLDSSQHKTLLQLKKQQKTTSSMGRVPAPGASGKWRLYCTKTRVTEQEESSVLLTPTETLSRERKGHDGAIWLYSIRRILAQLQSASESCLRCPYHVLQVVIYP